MSFYQKIWNDKKNRTLLISSIITIGFVLITVIIASLKNESAPNWLKWLYTPGSYNVGLTIFTMIFLMIIYWFTLISLGTVSEIKAQLPGWGSIVVSSILTILIGLFATYIRPDATERYWNYTSGMRWTIFGGLVLFIILSIIYLFLTETPEEQQTKSK